MNTDPVELAGLVAREVRSGEREGAPTRVVVARRTYSTDQTDLWDAVTNIERIPRWFLPISGDLKPGGRYQTEGNAGGVVERCDAPASFAVTWEMGPMVSWLEVTLSADGDETVLELIHEAPVDPNMWKQFGPGAVGVGWDLGLMGLGKHLSTGAALDASEELAFATSPEGVAFVRSAALGWAEAAVRNGDDADEARAAAESTVAFYTTLPESPPEG
jgi:uncharacterized protein YndB with AHSA1/START domain